VDRAEAAGVWHLREFQSKEVLGEKAEFKAERLEDRWIFSRFHRVAQQVNEALAEYRFDQAADAVYHFFWDEFCDWYIEIVKLRLTAGQRSSEAEKDVSRTAFMNVVVIFEASLRLLSPFMPFLTEELWQVLHDGRPVKASVALAQYPAGEKRFDDAAERDMAVLQEFVTTVRELRASAGVPPKESVPVNLYGAREINRIARENGDVIRRLGNIGRITEMAAAQGAMKGWARSTPNFDAEIVYEKKVDAEAERERIKKELESMEKERLNTIAQLQNERFLGKAPAQIVEGYRKRKVELDVLIAKAQQALERLDGRGA
jgi:valyl-tRNA synthetase